MANLLQANMNMGSYYYSLDPFSLSSVHLSFFLISLGLSVSVSPALAYLHMKKLEG